MVVKSWHWVFQSGKLIHQEFARTQTAMIRVHGTSVAFLLGDQWFAVLLRGSSGSGKSDLALRLIESGARLVADDQTELQVQDGGIVASVPERLAGRIEVRGVGIVEIEHLASARLVLVCDLCASEDVPRMPEEECVQLLDHKVGLLRVAPFEFSAPIKVRLGVEAARRGILGRNF